MPQLRDLFGAPVGVKSRRSRDAPVAKPKLERTRFKNPSGGGEPCLVENRKSNELEVIQLLYSLSRNKITNSLKSDYEIIARRISKIQDSNVIPKVIELLRQRPNYSVPQAIDLFDGYKEAIFKF